MADERFQDKALAKKDDAKIKGEPIEENLNPHEHKPEAKLPEAKAPVPVKALEKSKAPTKAKTDEKEAKDAKDEKPARNMVLERKYTVNLTDAYAKPKYKRSDRAISLLRDFCLRHMKGKAVKVSAELNNAIRTSVRPQKKVQVLLQKDEAGTVFAALAQKAG